MIETLAATVAAILAISSRDSIAGSLGEAAGRQVRRIRELVSTRFRGDARAEPALQAVDEAPTDEARVAALAAAVREHLAADPVLLAELTRLVSEVEKDPQAATFVTNVSGSAHVDKVTNIHDIHGNVTF